MWHRIEAADPPTRQGPYPRDGAGRRGNLCAAGAVIHAVARDADVEAFLGRGCLGAMDCKGFLAGHTDYLDGVLGAAEAAEFARHVDECPSCARYHRVLVKGRELLRTLPAIEPSRDFHSRLQHRLYHLIDGPQLDYGSRTSGTSTTAAVAIALLMAIAAWSPLIRAETPQIELPAIVVDEPRAASLGHAFPLFSTTDYALLAPTGSRSELPWSYSNMLLYRYSPLGWEERRFRSVRPVRIE